MVAKSGQCYTLLSCNQWHLFTTLPLQDQLVAKLTPVANDISISIDRDGRPLIFLWGNLADFQIYQHRVPRVISIGLQE